MAKIFDANHPPQLLNECSKHKELALSGLILARVQGRKIIYVETKYKLMPDFLTFQWLHQSFLDIDQYLWDGQLVLHGLEVSCLASVRLPIENSRVSHIRRKHNPKHIV